MGRKKGVLLSYVLMIFEIMSTLLLTPLIIRSLGQAEYGVYKLAASVAAYLMLLDMGVGNATIRYIAKYKATGEAEKERRFFAVAQIYYCVVAFAAGAVGVFLVIGFPKFFAVGLTVEEIQLGQKLLTIISINSAITLATSVFSNIIIGYGLFAVSRGASIIQIILRMVMTTIAMLAGLKSIAIVVIQLIMTVLCRGAFGAYVFFRLKLRPELRGVTKPFVKEIVSYSTWILLQMVATQINAFADQILLGIFVPGAAAIIAVYGVGVQIVQYFQSIGSVFSNVLMPGVVQMIEHKTDAHALQIEMIRIGRIILLVLSAILGGFIVYGKQFIELWAGFEYRDGYWVALILMSVYLFIQTESIGSQILWAKNEHKEQAILKILVVLLNVLLTVALIKWNPLLGATVGTFISLLVGDVVVMNVVFKKKIRISLTEYYKGLFKGIVRTFLIAVIAGKLFSLLRLSGWPGFICNVFVYCACFAAAAIKIGMNHSEKQMMSGIISIVMKKSRSKSDRRFAP